MADEGEEVLRINRLEIRPIAMDGLHLAVLSSFAIAQGFFGPLSNNPEVWVEFAMSSGEIIAFAIVVTVAPPLALWLVELVIGVGSEALRRMAHLGFVGGLTTLIALQALEWAADPESPLLVSAGLLLGATGAAVYRKLPLARSLVSALAPAPVVFCLLFLFLSPLTPLTLGASAGSPAPVAAARSPVVMVVLDELPTISLHDARGRIDPLRFPNFAALARDATYYRNATTVADATLEAVPAILTGRRPQGGLPIARNHPQNAFSLLATSHHLNVHEELTDLCPSSACLRRTRAPLSRRMGLLLSNTIGRLRLLPSPIGGRASVNIGQWSGLENGTFPGPALEREIPQPIPPATRLGLVSTRHHSIEDPVSAFERFVGSLAPTRKPGFHFLHVGVPHLPWVYLPSGRRYAPGQLPGLRLGAIARGDLWEDQWFGDPQLVRQGQQRHLMQVAFVDRLLGQLLRRLRATGLYERSLVVVTADHGASFRPNAPRRMVTRTNLPAIAAVPLFIKLPGQHGGRTSESPVRTIDILPTLAEALRVRLPQRVEGHSILGNAPSRASVVRVSSNAGGSVEMSASEVVRRRDTLARTQAKIFRSPLDPRGFGSGEPHSELIGRRVRELAAADGPGLRAKFDPPDAGSSSVLSPAFITGELLGPGAARDLAFAVDGRIVAVSRSFLLGGRRRFEVIVPESLVPLHPGALRPYAVRSRGRRRLDPL